jgi:exodeoxyribonuclease VII large subunit
MSTPFSTAAAPKPPVLSVWELTAQLQELVETAFPQVWVAGEVSNFSRAQSGHCYLTLKDDRAQLRAIIWRSTAARVRFELHDGLEVVCGGRIEVYAARGNYQLIIEQIEPRGLGALELAFRQLYEKLAREGLFDPRRKRPLPAVVRRVAVITSPAGAAIHDFLQVLARRWRGIDVLIIPVRVQGEGAAAEIAAAIQTANRLVCPLDCLVVTRGGGSLEDLWCFNEEAVVRAIFASRLPVVSAVGHEIDVTLSDLVADVRALTPSEAAERISPAREKVQEHLAQSWRRLRLAVRRQLVAASAKLEALSRHPALRRPLDRIRAWERELDERGSQAARAVWRRIESARQRTTALQGKLESLSPLAVLARGYSMTVRTVDGALVRDAATLQPGEQLTTRFASGSAISRVERADAPDISNFG